MIVRSRLYTTTSIFFTTTTTTTTITTTTTALITKHERQKGRQEQAHLDNEAELQESFVGDSIINTIEHTDFTDIEIGSKLYWVLKALSNDPSSSFALFSIWYFFYLFFKLLFTWTLSFLFLFKVAIFLTHVQGFKPISFTTSAHLA
jgi:hypothetical protein